MERRTYRVILFSVAILIGMAAGLFFGWSINPFGEKNTELNSLRIDYKTDFVLMIAELYHQQGDIHLAIERLGFLGDIPALVILDEAVGYAERNFYAPGDIRLMHDLAASVQTELGQ